MDNVGEIECHATRDGALVGLFIYLAIFTHLNLGFESFDGVDSVTRSLSYLAMAAETAVAPSIFRSVGWGFRSKVAWQCLPGSRFTGHGATAREQKWSRDDDSSPSTE